MQFVAGRRFLLPETAGQVRRLPNAAVGKIDVIVTDHRAAPHRLAVGLRQPRGLGRRAEHPPRVGASTKDADGHRDG